MTRRKNPADKKKGGRPTRYRAEYAEVAYGLCLLGATDEELAEYFKVTPQTVDNWKKRHPAFFESIKRGKVLADVEVTNALRQRALGYSHPEEKIFQHEGKIIRARTMKHYPPDTNAASLWLRNRQPGKWRDKVQQEHTGLDDGPIVVEVVKFGRGAGGGQDSDSS